MVGGCHAFVGAEMSQNAINQVTLKFLAHTLKWPFDCNSWLLLPVRYATLCQVYTSKTHYI
jgi:hypothetical protein